MKEGAADKFERLFVPQRFSAAAVEFASRWTPVNLTLTLDAPMLSQGPADEDAAGNELRARVDESDGVARLVIPGSSLKGAVRARAARIARTIAQQIHGTVCEHAVTSVLEPLFGGSDYGAGCLRFGDATAVVTNTQRHQQTFNAVDRFAGGVSQGALYVATTPYPRQLQAPMGYDPARLLADDNQGARTLLWFLVRDALEGDMALGWGKAKGFGAFRLHGEVFLPPAGGDTEAQPWFGIAQARVTEHQADIEQGWRRLGEQLAPTNIPEASRVIS